MMILMNQTTSFQNGLSTLFLTLRKYHTFTKSIQFYHLCTNEYLHIDEAVVHAQKNSPHVKGIS